MNLCQPIMRYICCTSSFASLGTILTYVVDLVFVVAFSLHHRRLNIVRLSYSYAFSFSSSHPGWKNVHSPIGHNNQPSLALCPRFEHPTTRFQAPSLTRCPCFERTHELHFSATLLLLRLDKPAIGRLLQAERLSLCAVFVECEWNVERRNGSGSGKYLFWG